jgi:hypothetical protein
MARKRSKAGPPALNGGKDFTSGFTENVLISRPDPPSSKIQRLSSLITKERLMNPLFLIAAPLVLIILGMILNGIGLSYDQPASSTEEDPAKKIAAERQAYRSFFDLQRKQALKRQQRIGQYAWLVLIVSVVASIWTYFDTVNKTAALNQIAAIQTMATAEGKDLVLSVTLRDGNNVKYVIKAGEIAAADSAAKNRFSKEPVPAWEMSRLATALSTGDKTLPLGIELTISN